MKVPVQPSLPNDASPHFGTENPINVFQIPEPFQPCLFPEMPFPRQAILRNYAQKKDPSSLPPSILFHFTKCTITIFDAYPKAMFHFLILPRIVSPLIVENTTTLKALFKSDKDLAQKCLRDLAADAEEVRGMVETEMIKRYGFKWPIWSGFHAVQSMEHLHLHVISSDLCSPSLKNKKHYNSFHPKVGFFLHLDDVLSWFDAEPTYYKTITRLTPSDYDEKLKMSLSCFKCEKEMKNIPVLKLHLQEEWDLIAKLGTSKSNGSEKKRTRDDLSSDSDDDKRGPSTKARK